MEVVLLERIPKLGAIGDVVRVKKGYARNCLIPMGKALRATKENLKRFQQARETLEKENEAKRAEASRLAEKMSGQRIRAVRQAGESDQIYGSVTARDMARLCSEAGFAVERSQILLDKPIKTLGLHKVSVRLHADVEIALDVEVTRTEDEAPLEELSEESGEEESQEESEEEPKAEDAS